jgi:prepilin-type N-terminal cleavage/methylation domain-containing protein
MKKNFNKQKNAGFTLLELVVVVAVMGLISTMAMDVYTDNTNQIRYDLTKKRVEEIRYAIIGDDSRSQLTISGFIADTGSVPTELRQLIMEEYCDQDPWYNTEATCNGAGNTWIKQQDNNWQGPYLIAYATELFSRKVGTDYIGKVLPVFRDGWGRTIRNTVDNTTDSTQMDQQIEDMKNFGWNFNEASGDITVQSYGLDRDTTGTELYELEYPATGLTLIPKHYYDYAPNSYSLAYKISNNSGLPETVCLIWDGIVTNNSGSQTILTTTPIESTITFNKLGVINFTLEKDTDGDCNTNDGNITLSNNIIAVHKSIVTPKFTANFSSVP